MEHLTAYQGLFSKQEHEITEILQQQKIFVLQEDKEVAKALGITQPETVYIIRSALEVYNWNQYVQATNKGENSETKNFFPNIVKHNINEDISKKLTRNIHNRLW